MAIYRVFTFLFTLIFLISSNSANAFDWSKAPLACLPDRAIKWETQNEKEPCHCPPQSYCPNVEINAENVVFNVYANVIRGRDYEVTFTGQDVLDANPDIELETLFTADVVTLRGYLSPLVSTSLSNVWGYTYNMTLRNAGSDLQDVLNNTFTMPNDFVTRCCESPCPEGTILENVTQGMEVLDADTCPRTECERNDDDELVDEDCVEGEPIVDSPMCEYKTVQVETAQCSRSLYKHREGCILEGTEILTSTGELKKIDDLKLGDKIMGKSGEVTITALNKFTQNEDEMYGINGGIAFISVEHPILTTTGWKAIDPEVTSVKSNLGVVGKLQAGDEIIRHDGSKVKVVTIDKHNIKDGTTAYNLSVDDNKGFVANGMVVKSFNQVQIHY